MNETEGRGSAPMNAGKGTLWLYVGSERHDLDLNAPEVARVLREAWDRRDLRQGQDAIVVLEVGE